MPASEAAPRAPVQPLRLLRLPISAYRPTLRVADDAVYLLTEHAAYRLAPDGATQKFDLELGLGATLTPSSFVYWSNGAVQRASKSGGKPERVVTLAEPPQYFVSSGEEIAWLARSSDGTFSIQIPAAKQAKTLLTSHANITALIILHSWAFFVESSAGTWRVGAVSEANEPKYARLKTGRAPSMLATANDQLYYYDGERSQIVQLRPDLQAEEEWVKDVICSPIAVAEAAYCGSVEGLFTVSQAQPAPRMLVPNVKSLVTTLAADATHVAWLRDTGPDQLAVEMLDVSERE
jgi:hypothetical protein